MKKILAMLLFSGCCYAQRTTVHMYYSTGELAGMEIMRETWKDSNKFLGAGFSGALHQREALGDLISGKPTSNDLEYKIGDASEEYYSAYFVGCIDFTRHFLLKGKLGYGCYTNLDNFESNGRLYHKRTGNAFIPLVGASIFLPLTNHFGVEVGGDCFNGASAGLTIMF